MDSDISIGIEQATSLTEASVLPATPIVFCLICTYRTVTACRRYAGSCTDGRTRPQWC